MKFKKTTFVYLISSLGLVSITAAGLLLAMMMLGRVARAVIPVGLIASGVLIGLWVGCIFAIDVLENRKSPD